MKDLRTLIGYEFDAVYSREKTIHDAVEAVMELLSEEKGECECREGCQRIPCLCLCHKKANQGGVIKHDPWKTCVDPECAGRCGGKYYPQKPSEEERHPLAIGSLRSGVTGRQTQGLVIEPRGIKFILKHAKCSEILNIKEILVTLEDRNGFAHPRGAVVEVSFDALEKFL